MKNSVQSLIIDLFDIEKYTKLLITKIITFQKLFFDFSSDSHLHAPLISRCEVQKNTFVRKYDNRPCSSFREGVKNDIFGHGNDDDRTTCTAMG